ncbi:Aldehyde dehydrogenase family 8 member A1 [Araneus ventricosus]|uniref:Aldehyde dehydrogenase family 8 member A1 n=1 Tax=Araneus ventricosus TaxID=182803 RepID=A0A4Y2ILA0_ARAVE|nr:Aldehyde dehydrogenase family 8 member A1 [Araneus ventricosus]
MSGIIVVKNFINGEFVESRKFLDSFNPATGEVLARVPDSDALDVEQAVRAARNAFPEWSNKEPSVRSKLLHRLADLLESRLVEFATAESRDQGKPLWLAHKIEIPRAVLNIRHFANTILCDKEMLVDFYHSCL